MIKDKTIDEALIEIMRTKRALEALRASRKDYSGHGAKWYPNMPECAAAKRASLDLTHKLADLREGR